MSFSVNVAADVFGEKVNLKLPFPQRPSFIELQRAIESAFGEEMRAVTPERFGKEEEGEGAAASRGRFEISALQIYEESGGGWEILRSCAALTPDCQLYAFQRAVTESSFDIPSPRAPRTKSSHMQKEEVSKSFTYASDHNNVIRGAQSNERGLSSTTQRRGSVASAAAAAGGEVEREGREGGVGVGQTSNDLGEAISAAHIQQRGTSPPRPAGLADETAAHPSLALLKAAAPTGTSGVQVASSSSHPLPFPSSLPRQRAPAPTTLSAIDALNKVNATVTTATTLSNTTSHSFLDASSSSHIAGPAGGLVTLKQKLFSDPNPTIEHKVRTVFDELDVNHNRQIEISEFQQTLTDMRITLSEREVKDIFIRSDKDHDGSISFNEFEWLAIHYPTLVDALYFRLKEAYEERRKRDVIESRRRAVDEELQRQSEETVRMADLRRRIDEYESQLLNLEQERKTREYKERECQAKLVEAKKESDGQKALRKQRDNDVAAAKENEKQRHSNLVEAQKSVGGAQRKVSELESDLSRCQEKESQLEKLLEAARKETDVARKSLQRGVEEASEWRELEQKQFEMYAESQKEVQKMSQHVVAADAELDSLLKFAAACEEQLLTAQRETALAAHRREQQQALLRQQSDKIEEHAQIMSHIVSSLDKARAALDAADRDLSDFRQRRLKIEAQEKPLIEQEVALRAQRFALEEQETMHRYEKVSFYNSAGRPAGSTAAAAAHHSFYGSGHDASALHVSAAAEVGFDRGAPLHYGSPPPHSRSAAVSSSSYGRAAHVDATEGYGTAAYTMGSAVGGGTYNSGGGSSSVYGATRAKSPSSAAVRSSYSYTNNNSNSSYMSNREHHQHQRVSYGNTTNVSNTNTIGVVGGSAAAFPLPSPAAHEAYTRNSQMQHQFLRANSASGER